MRERGIIQQANGSIDRRPWYFSSSVNKATNMNMDNHNLNNNNMDNNINNMDNNNNNKTGRRRNHPCCIGGGIAIVACLLVFTNQLSRSLKLATDTTRRTATSTTLTMTHLAVVDDQSLVENNNNNNKNATTITTFSTNNSWSAATTATSSAATTTIDGRSTREDPTQANSTQGISSHSHRHRRPYFILHIGPSKTGTTSIQCALWSWQDQLMQDGYVVFHTNDCTPSSQKRRWTKGKNNNDMPIPALSQCIMVHAKPSKHKHKQQGQDCMEYYHKQFLVMMQQQQQEQQPDNLATNGSRPNMNYSSTPTSTLSSIIVSSEWFYELAIQYPVAFRTFLERISLLFDIKIVAYHRNAWDRTYSLYRQKYQRPRFNKWPPTRQDRFQDEQLMDPVNFVRQQVLGLARSSSSSSLVGVEDPYAPIVSAIDQIRKKISNNNNGGSSNTNNDETNNDLSSSPSLSFQLFSFEDQHDLVGTFLCQALPTATATCRAYNHHAPSNQEQQKQPRSQSIKNQGEDLAVLWMDPVALEANQRNLFLRQPQTLQESDKNNDTINTTIKYKKNKSHPPPARIHRKTVARHLAQTILVQELEVLGNTTTQQQPSQKQDQQQQYDWIPWICPSRRDLEALYKISQQQDKLVRLRYGLLLLRHSSSSSFSSPVSLHQNASVLDQEFDPNHRRESTQDALQQQQQDPFRHHISDTNETRYDHARLEGVVDEWIELRRWCRINVPKLFANATWMGKIQESLQLLFAE